MSKITQRKPELAKFTSASLSIIMGATLLIYFAWAVVYQKYILSFAFDALVGSIGFVLMVSNLFKKYSYLKKFSNRIIQYGIIDIISFIISLTVKFGIQNPFDFTLVILVIAYFVSKQVFIKEFKLN